MAFKKDDNVLVTAPVLRKNPETGVPETLNLTDEPGVVKKAQTYKGKPEKNQYHVKTQYGVAYANESKVTAAP